MTKKDDPKGQKLIVYQLFPRLFTNVSSACVRGGNKSENGCGKMNDITLRVLKSIRDLGVNAMWYTGIVEHASQTAYTAEGIPADDPHVVKGKAGSPYAIRDFYDVDPDLAVNVSLRREEFHELVERTHKAGMKAIIDFVPNHTARRYHSDCAPAGVRDFGDGDDTTKFFAPDNNYYYITSQRFCPRFDVGSYYEFPAKATGNDSFTAFPGEYDWYETVKLNYGHDYGDGSDHFDPVPDTWLKMVSVLRHWASLGVDGFRCDMVFMVPLEFWHWAIAEVKKDYPDIIFIGEIYDVRLYRPFLDYGGFDYLYDKVNLYDTLRGIQVSNYSAAQITGCWQTVDGIGEKMLNFLENHDEVRFGSVEYAGNPSLVIPSLVVSAMINRGPMMIYYAQELGERALDNEGFAGDNHRTTIFDYWSLSTLRRWYNGGKADGALLTQQERWLRGVYAKVLKLCNSEKAISLGTFFDLMYVNLQNPELDPHRQFVFLRHYGEETLFIAVNFADIDARMKVTVPDAAFDYCDLPQGEAMCTELLSGRRAKKSLMRGEPFAIDVEAHGAAVWKLRHAAFRLAPLKNNV